MKDDEGFAGQPEHLQPATAGTMFVQTEPVKPLPEVTVTTTGDGLWNFTFPSATPERHGDPRFYKLLEEIAALHSGKSHDYTPAGDPLANFKRAERFGVPAWKGTLIRMGDKFGRLEQLGGNGKTPANESMRDTLIDLAVYALLCVLLLEDAG